jgi:hypothetical protein
MSTDGGFLQVHLEGVQDWISSGATELSVLAGGSVLLREAFEAAAQEVADWLERQGHPRVPADVPEERMAGDGPPQEGFWFPVVASGTISGIFAHQDTAAEAGRRLERALRRWLPGASVDVKAGRYPRQPVDGQMPYVAARRGLEPLRTWDDHHEQPEGAPTSMLPGARLCAACGARAATGPPPRRDRSVEAPWCAACIDRHRASQARTGIDKHAHAAGLDGAKSLELATQFNHIGRASTSPRYLGYMAVLAADGDGVGQRVTEVTSPVGLCELSRHIERSVIRAIECGLTAGATRRRQASATDGGRDGDGSASSLPYNPVIVAGDDIVLAVPADVGLVVAAALARAEPDLPMSAGVVVCHDSLPFSVALTAAEALKRRAKKATRAESAGSVRPHVAFAVESAGAVRPDLESDPLRGLPYPAAAIDELRDTAAQLGVTPSRAGAVVDALRQGGRLAEREWARYLLSEEKPVRKQLARLYTELGGSERRGRPEGPKPWLSRPVDDEPIDGENDPRPGMTPFEDLLLVRSLEGA